MKRIVIKFGGTSVGSIEKIINSAKIIKKRHEEGNEVIVVVSAMSGTTNDLINRSKQISDNFNKSEYIGFDYYAGDNVDVVGDAHKLSSYFIYHLMSSITYRSNC